MKTKFYVAYGSNLNVAQMRYRCPNAKIIGTSEITDFALLFKGSKSGAYLTIEQQTGASVPVAVWAVSPTDEQSLDRYEGYPSFYYKREIALPVAILGTDETATLNTFVYIMHEERKLGIPTQSYVDCCLEGYRNFGFDVKFLKEALQRSGVTK